MCQLLFYSSTFVNYVTFVVEVSVLNCYSPKTFLVSKTSTLSGRRGPWATLGQWRQHSHFSQGDDLVFLCYGVAAAFFDEHKNCASLAGRRLRTYVLHSNRLLLPSFSTPTDPTFSSKSAAFSTSNKILLTRARLREDLSVLARPDAMPSAQFKKAADESRQLKAKPGNDELLEVSATAFTLRYGHHSRITYWGEG